MSRKSENLIKIVNIAKENLHIIQTTCGISINISGKMCLIIILKVIKKQSFTLFLENTFWEKPQQGRVGGGGVQIEPSGRFRVNLNVIEGHWV